MNKQNQRVFSGIQPSGEIHIGNYMGAIKKWVELSDDFDCLYCVVDEHAITVDFDPRKLPVMTFDAVLATMACGLSPDKCTIFVQSHVPEHTELTWLFNTITPLGSLFRMTQFKDKSRNSLQRALGHKEGGARKSALHHIKNMGEKTMQMMQELSADVSALDPEADLKPKDDAHIMDLAARINASAGNIMQQLQVGLGVADASTALFSYPVLQAADILLYKASLIPVGEDQEQHLELCREIAERFNRKFGDVFPMAQRVRGETPKIMGIDGKQKMSKSLKNHISVLEKQDDIIKKLKGAYTDPQRVRRSDPGHPEVCNIFSLHKLFSSEDRCNELAEGCRAGKIGCFDCKKHLADGLNTVLEPIRDKEAALRANPARVLEAIDAGRNRAGDIAAETMREVRQVMGIGRKTITSFIKEVENKNK